MNPPCTNLKFYLPQADPAFICDYLFVHLLSPISIFLFAEPSFDGFVKAQHRLLPAEHIVLLLMLSVWWYNVLEFISGWLQHIMFCQIEKFLKRFVVVCLCVRAKINNVNSGSMARVNMFVRVHTYINAFGLEWAKYLNRQYYIKSEGRVTSCGAGATFVYPFILWIRMPYYMWMWILEIPSLCRATLSQSQYDELTRRTLSEWIYACGAFQACNVLSVASLREYCSQESKIPSMYFYLCLVNTVYYHEAASPCVNVRVRWWKAYFCHCFIVRCISIQYIRQNPTE